MKTSIQRIVGLTVFLLLLLGQSGLCQESLKTNSHKGAMESRPETNGGIWFALDSGVNGAVNAIAVRGNDVYVGGSFTTAGGVPANNIARWDGTNWYPLGGGVNGEVFAIGVTENFVYVGGNFTEAGGERADYIAEWDMTEWYPLGGPNVFYQHLDYSWSSSYGPYGWGFNGEVRAIAVNGNDVYIGGSFTEAHYFSDNVPAKCIAKWDGSTLSELGGGVTEGGLVDAIAVSGNNVYVGGDFIWIGSVKANGIARWDGTSWFPLGDPMFLSEYDHVQDIAVDGNDVYIATGGVIAKWDGNDWFGLGGFWCWHAHEFTWVPDGLNTIAVHRGNLYVGGWFDKADDVIAKNIAMWDRSSWSDLRGGVTGEVFAIEIAGNDVFVGGDFDWAGDIPVQHIAGWVEPPAEPFGILSVTDVGNDQGRQVRVLWNRVVYDGASYAYKMTNYCLWRQVDNRLSSTSLPLKMVTTLSEMIKSSATTSKPTRYYVEQGKSSQNEVWDLVASIPTHHLDQYAYVAPTLADSTSKGIPWSVFFVSAHTSNPDIFFDCSPDSGYSVDNLAPSTPKNLELTGKQNETKRQVTLSWKSVPDEDFAYYVVYRDTKEGFNPSTVEPYETTIDTFLTDSDLDFATTYYYRVSAFDFSGNESDYSEYVSTASIIPEKFALYQNYPNPFNPKTTILYSVPSSTRVELTIYNLKGDEIITLVNKYQPAGYYAANWDGRNERNNTVASGVYLYRLKAGSFIQTRKLVLMR